MNCLIIQYADHTKYFFGQLSLVYLFLCQGSALAIACLIKSRNNNNMRLFGIILRIVELILLISISVLIVCVLWTCEDKATLTDCLSESAVGLFWLFPITIPIAVCLLVSLFVSLIKSVKTKNVYNKFIFGIHLFNIFVIPLTFLFLPSSGEPPTAQAMADNYYKHAEDMKCLVELIEDYVGNDGGIDYSNVNGKILALSIKSGGKWIHQKEINAQWQKGNWYSYRK
jgi:hypothetical protein